MREFVASLGKRSIDFIKYAGGVSVLYGKTLFWMVAAPMRPKHVYDQMVKVGVNSFAISAMTSFFMGIVLTFQSAYQMKKVGAEMYIPSLVSISMTREIGPILTAIVVAGRVGASIAAELGSMKVTEQIEALEALGTNPIKYLVTPRFIALFTMLPLLTIFADGVGIFGGYLISTQKLGISHSLFMRMTFDPLVLKDIFSGLFKSLVFASIICIISCYEGMRVSGGAEGVGAATTKAVVASFILIIASDAFFTVFFYFLT